MREFTIVTDFFDIGRGQDANKMLSRTKEKYFEEFAYWAKIRNKMIVYTDPISAERVREIRESYGLLDKTVIVEIDNLFELEGDLLKRMIEVSENEGYLKFRYFPKAFSNNPRYDYMWFMKYYFMNDALQRGLLGEAVAWVDFGFDHGGRTFVNSDDFDFTWKYDFSDKIHLFCLSDPDEVNVMDIVQMQEDCVMGNLSFMPRTLVAELWGLVRKAMEALLMLDCLDDDQALLLMAYRNKPEIFEMHVTSWSLPMKECGGEHLKVKENKSDIKKKTSIIKKIKTKIQPYFWWVKGQKKDFAKRSYERAEQFYK